MYKYLDEHGSRTSPWLHHAWPNMAARAWINPSPKQLEDLRRLLCRGLIPPTSKFWYVCASDPDG
jgi:hypothetical protein